MQRTHILFLLAVICVIFIVFFWKSHPVEHPALEPDMIKRSQQYIEQLSQKPLIELNREEKLLLLHSYANLGKDLNVVTIGSQMIVDLQSLPTERQKAFVTMVTDAYRRLGRDREAQAYYHQVVDAQ